MSIRHRGPAGLVLVALTALACTGGGGGGGGGGSATASPTGGGGGASLPAASSPVASAPGATTAAGSSDGGGGGSIPDDACQFTSKADIEELFGGEVAANGLDDDDVCVFTVKNGKGRLIDYDTAESPVTITFNEDYTTYAEEHAALGDDVAKVEGLGGDAWEGLGAIHVQIPPGELIVCCQFGAVYDQTVIHGEFYALAKLILSRL